MTFRLAVDFGTSNTVGALAAPDGTVRPLLFDGSPLLPSAVLAGDGPAPLVGADAVRAAITAPAAFEPNPKRRIDEGTILLGGRDLPVEHLIAAVLRRVHDEAVRVAGGPVAEAVLTHPAAWGAPRRAVLAAAAAAAGLPAVRLVPEPVAAAAHFAGAHGGRPTIVVYDLGAGTFDATILRGPDVLATAGLPDVGGLDLDAAVVHHARTHTADAADAWRRLDAPRTEADRRARQALWHSARAAKEQLSRHPGADVHVPIADRTVHVTREEFERAAHPALERTAALTRSLLHDAGVPREAVTAVFLVGGSSRIPLAATLLHRALGIAPTVLDQPELVVAEGALAGARQPAAATPPSPPPAPPRRRRRVAPLVAAGLAALAIAVFAAIRWWPSHSPDPGHSPGPDPSVYPAAWAGTWKGQYTQTNGKTHQMQVIFTAGSKTAHVRYLDQSCQGTLTLLPGDGVIRAQESITSGSCTATGIMTMHLGGDGRLELTYQPDGAPYTATATLAR